MTTAVPRKEVITLPEQSAQAIETRVQKTADQLIMPIHVFYYASWLAGSMIIIVAMRPHFLQMMLRRTHQTHKLPRMLKHLGRIHDYAGTLAWTIVISLIVISLLCALAAHFDDIAGHGLRRLRKLKSAQITDLQMITDLQQRIETAENWYKWSKRLRVVATAVLIATLLIVKTIDPLL